MSKKIRNQGNLNGFLDAGSFIEGELHFEDTFRIDGKLTGGIVSNGDLFIGEKGDVEGDIRVRRIFISGKLRGSLEASEVVEITSKGRVTARLNTPSLTVEEGAFFEGYCSMSAEESGVEPIRATSTFRIKS